MRRSYWPIVVMAFVWSGCDSGEEQRDVAAPVFAVTFVGHEEEVFGNIYGWESVNRMATLMFRDQESYANRPEYWTNAVGASGGHHNSGADFGWYGIGSPYTECMSATDFTLNQEERHFPFGPYELHCVQSGRFTLFIDPVGVSREIDYVEYAGTADGADIESATPVGTTGNTVDVIVHFDSTSNGSNGTPVIEVDVKNDRAFSSWQGAQVSSGQTRSGGTSQWFRFGAWNSTTTWEPQGLGELLVRYFWDYDGDRAERTGFTNATAGETNTIRVHQFPPGLHHVVAHVVEPDEFGPVDSTDWGSSLSFYVRACDANLVALQMLPVPASPTVNDTVKFEALTGIGQDGCGDLEFRWLIDSTLAQDWSAAGSVFETVFTSSGQRTVTLDVRDGIGQTDADTVTITVTKPQPPSVSIDPSYANPNGPVQPNELCDWRAVIQGEPDSIVWHKSFRYGWLQVGTGRWLEMNTGTRAFDLRVTVTAAGGQASDTLSVTLSSRFGQYCP